jgi:tetratricopeptide (TPR) repeat protein
VVALALSRLALWPRWLPLSRPPHPAGSGFRAGRPRRRFWLLGLLAITCLLPIVGGLSGCSGGGNLKENQVQGAYQAYESGAAAMLSADYESAQASYAAAVAAGGLSPDLLEEAALGQAECLVRLGRFAEAQRPLELLGDQTSQPGRWWFWRGRVYAGLGDTASAQQAAATGKQLDPRFKPPSL